MNRKYSVPGGAIKNVSDFWDNQPFLVINADIVADIDLAKIYEAHSRHQSAATLVLCDDPAFNSVSVEQNRWITGFCDRSCGDNQTDGSLLTFTGVQVLDPLVLDYIPAGKPYSSIDAFKKILSDGHRLRAVVVPKDRWQDVGTPSSYRQAAIDKAIPRAFKEAYSVVSNQPVERIKLKGDGSQRRWYRLKTRQHSLIMVDHGIREAKTTSEVDSFVLLGKHLYSQGVSVPRIYFHDTFCGLVFLDDLGDEHLQQAALAMNDPEKIFRLYQSVIDQMILLSSLGAEKFDRKWTYQTPTYDRKLILEKECRYFQRAFLNRYLGHKTHFEDFESEFISLADNALRDATIGFMHRDMQSRNIMLYDGNVYFIDFQGGRIGPIQYDLAALIIDPYVELQQPIQNRLLDYSIRKLSLSTLLEPDKFRSCYRYCAIARNLQILGAFAYLSKVKGKHYFKNYISPALQTLRSNLMACGRDEFPILTAVVEKACGQLQKTGHLSSVANP